jgi:aldose 1-epimerase
MAGALPSFDSGDAVQLNNGRLRVMLAPEIGGSVARFDILSRDQTLPLFRPAKPGADSVLDMGCFPVVPFANRIRGGAFAFRGRTITMQPNIKGERLPLHGQGWLHPWTVQRADACTAELAHEHAAGEWPWHYEAHQLFCLDDTGLEIRLSCRNLSAEDMPCGLALHPYFPCTATTVLDAPVHGVWTIDADVLPVSREPAIERYDLRDRRICGAGLDNGFEGWSGRADITWPDTGAAMTIVSPAPRLQIFSPPSGGIFVVEPATNANAALNAAEADWPELGLVILKPGEATSLTARFEVRVLAA